jgi:ectoine hydroxylase-related dioxygenase (phytanoyl-CoA dioxygenase family)
MSAPFESDGFTLVPEVLSPHECETISGHIRTNSSSGGTRNLLSNSWCTSLAARLVQHPSLSQLITSNHFAVQCTYFEKSAERNWLVPFHQDLSIPVAHRVSEPSLRGWSEKEGALFVQAPVELLEQLVAVRVHLDACMEVDGPLKVIPGTHRQGVIAPDAAASISHSTPAVLCVAPLGAALVMRPLLLHASSKSTGNGRRRVLHFLYGPPRLMHGLQWQHGAP